MAEPVQQHGDADAARRAEHQAEADLLHKAGNEFKGHPERWRRLRSGQFHKHHGQENRHGIVGAGFHFQRRLHPVAQFQPADTQQEKHRRRVGRGDDRAEQHGFNPGDPEQVMRRDADKTAGQHNPGGSEHQRRRRRKAIAAQGRVKSTVEENDRQRQRADEIGDAAAVEGDAQEAVFAGEQADAQEHQQQGRADPSGNQARQRAERDQTGAEKDGDVNRFRQTGTPYG